MSDTAIAPGTKIEVRDAEWIVRRVDRTSNGAQSILAEGLSELVKDKKARFLTDIDDVSVLDPAETELVPDNSSSFKASKLYMESLLRQKPPTDNKIYVGHQAAMDPVPYQLDPAIQALDQVRQRILIADEVGLGKTIECGILLSELIRRGRGKRILVCTMKSLMTQFQKEMWSRFTIPLVSIDSREIQKIRQKIPSNHNPFYYYDKTIVSIDTIKQDSEYRTYLEDCSWDIIVIDEAHRVAERGSSTSQRARLAKLLSKKSDSLIMLSATPHDGSSESFASLMNMLNPTAIADPENYGPEDIEGLFVRRYKKDVKHQVEKAFRERTIRISTEPATSTEESVFDSLVNLEFDEIGDVRSGGMLFKTTLEKALFSSPAACLETVHNRIQREKKKNHTPHKDVQLLQQFADEFERITPEAFSKYQNLLKQIQDEEEGFGWDGSDPQDRLVIFTERIRTMEYLEEHLTEDLDLGEDQVEVLYGSLADVEQQEVVEDFGKDNANVRLLIASDMASEGIDLHHLCHRMIHFDIPWSLLTFRQRNGRIDRYGQTDDPKIVYLKTESENDKIHGDSRILEILIEKDQKAHENIGDPRFFTGASDEQEEEKMVAEAIETDKSADELSDEMDQRAETAVDPMRVLRGEDQPVGQQAETVKDEMPSLYDSDYAYMKHALRHIQRDGKELQLETIDDENKVYLTAEEEIRHRFQKWPDHFWPEDEEFVLTAELDEMKDEIRRSRQDEEAWPKKQFLWELHPIVSWVNDKVLASFGRQQAPVIPLMDTLQSDEVVILLSGLLPNKKSHPLVHRWFGVRYLDGEFDEIENFSDFLRRTLFDKRTFPNPEIDIDTQTVEQLLPDSIEYGEMWMKDRRNEFENEINEKLNERLDRLQELQQEQKEYITNKFDRSDRPEAIRTSLKDQELRKIDNIFNEWVDWVEESMTTDKNPSIQVIAAFCGEDQI